MIGQTIGQYQVLEKLGEGGMGVVYRARDTRLDRDVALKFLPGHISATKETTARFLQEARAAAALNHANICTIYGVEEHDGDDGSRRMFIAMEYIDGGTLREKLPLAGVAETVSVATQVGEALLEAHSKGIVHRDVKADNIMLTSKGQAKVMDFGLAKLKGSLKLTKTSSTVGTLGYMAPEQVAGGEVDHRSDLFSFGVLLFEMLTGRLPFRGEHEAAMVYSIVHEPPEPLTKYLPDAPAELGYIIAKALEKDPADRYQSASEMLVDLRRLKKSTTRISRPFPTSPELERTASGELVSAYHPAMSSGSLAAGTFPADVKGSGWIKLAGLLAGAVIVVSAVLFLVNAFRDDAVIPSVTNVKMSRLTSEGDAGFATVSPDGRYVVFVRGHPGEYGLSIRQIATGSEVTVIPPSDIRLTGSTFSNDGNYVYYTASLPGARLASVYRTPVLGGTTPRKIIENVDSPVSLSPDDRRIAFIRTFTETGEEAIFTANADGTGERKLASRDGKNLFFASEGGAPAWSPDGKVIVSVAGSTLGGFAVELVAIPVDDPKENVFTKERWGDVGRVVWHPDGNGLIVCANGEEGPTQIVYVSYPDGAVSRITNDLLEYGPTSLSVTKDGGSIVTVQSQTNSNIAIAARGAGSAPVELTGGATRDDGTRGVGWMDNRRVVYTTSQGGARSFWSVGIDGSERRQLTFSLDGPSTPAMSPDGKYLYFCARKDSSLPSIWRMPAGGGEPERMTSDEDYEPSLSPDGRWLVHDSWRSGARSIWKVPLSGGGPASMVRQGAFGAALSPDGKRLACYAHDSTVNRMRPTVLEFPSGKPVAVTDFPNTVGQTVLHWSPDGKTVHFVDSRKGVSNLWSWNPVTGKQAQVTAFASGKIFWFAWSPDGKNLALARGSSTSDIVLLTVNK